MTDEPDPSRDRARIEPTSTGRRLDFLPSLYFVGFVVLAGTLLYLYMNPPLARLAPEQAGQVDTLQSQVASLRAEVARLSDRPAAADAGPALEALQRRVAAIEGRPAASPDAVGQLQAQVGSIAGLSSRVGALEARPAATPDQLALLSQQVQTLGRQVPDIAPLNSRVAALEARPQVDPAALDRRFDELAGQGKQVTAQLQSLGGQQKATADQLQALTQRTQLATRLQSAAALLAAGQKLGDIPGAPPALARFANEAPPTEAALRGSFDTYATAAEKAQPASTEGQDFGSRLWSRAQQSVTVRQGDHVIVGDPISGILAHAKDLLDNGDLPGAVDSLKGLSGPAASAMQPWLDRARALLDARAAIATMAAG